MATKRKKAIGYARVSTVMQKQDGISLDAQREKIEAMASLKDYDLAGDIVVEQGSGKNLDDRPEVTRLLTLADKRQVDAVVVYSLDRLTRNLEDLSAIIRRLDKARVALVSVSESLDTRTATGRMMVKMIGMIAEWQREYIAERTREAMVAAQAKGRRMTAVGRLPYGWQIDPDSPKKRSKDGKQMLHTGMMPNPAERKTIARMVDLKGLGYSFADIADTLDSEGRTQRNGKAWNKGMVYQVLARELGAADA